MEKTFDWKSYLIYVLLVLNIISYLNLEKRLADIQLHKELTAFDHTAAAHIETILWAGRAEGCLVKNGLKNDSILQAYDKLMLEESAEIEKDIKKFLENAKEQNKPPA